MKYDAALDSYLSYAPADRTDGYTFDGWYKDPECTQSVDTLTMPYSNMIVFGKWNPPDHTVTFNVNGGTMDATQTVFTGIPHGATVNGIANVDGEWLDSYKPVRENFTFVGWFYGDVRFIPMQAVKANLDLIAVWEPMAATTYADVTIKYVYVDGAERVPFRDDEGNAITEVRENLAVNSVCVAQAEYFEGYYPLSTLDSVLVVDDAENNVITFVYRKIQKWEYSVEYYAYYRSYETSGVDFSAALDGFSGFAAGPDAHYIRTGSGEAYSQYQSVMLTIPAEFKENYHFHSYEYGGETGYDTRVTIHPDEANTAVIKVYLEPDPSLLAVSDRVELYDGNPLSPVKGRDTLSEFSVGEKTVKAEIMNVYRYFDADGTPIEKAIDADAYKMHGYTVLKTDVTQGGDTTSRYYLLYKDENEGDALNLRIRRRAVTLTSDSDSKTYDGEPLKKDGITATGDGFVEGEGYSYAFSVEAFRLDTGTSDNSFTYSLLDGTKATNYDITVVFGTLTVTD